MDMLIHFLADYLLLIILAVGAGSLLWFVPNRQKAAVYTRIIVAGLTALVVAKFMAALYQPEIERPFQILGVSARASYLDNPGFPSDHALLAMVMLGAVWYGVRCRWLTAGLAIAVVLICVGRMLALVHTPLDVIGGLVAAAIGFLWYVDDHKVARTTRHLHKS